MTSPNKRNGGSNSVLPEFMTSPSVGDFILGWLGEEIQRAEDQAREAGNSRAMAWEIRTLRRAHGQLAPIVERLAADDEQEG